MNAKATMEEFREMSPRAKARLAGGLYLLTMVLGGFAQGVVSDRLVVVGDASATATNIAAHSSLYHLGFAAYLVEMACQIAMTALFYDLLTPVSKSVSRLTAIFGLVGCTIKIVSRLFFISPLLVLGGAEYLSVFSTDQLQALGLLLLRMNYRGETITMVFFGIYAILLGYLIIRSGFLPRFLGVFSVVGGVGWLTYLHEPFAASVAPFVLGVSVVGALLKVVWLIVYGVNEDRWKARAVAARTSIWR